MSKATSTEQLALIYDGVTVTTLSQIFDMDHKEVNKRVVGRVTPVSESNGRYAKYRIRDAAPYLIDHKVDPEEYLKNLSPTKLPPALQDSFWKAQLSRQKYEENKKDLWRTARVVEVVASAFKVVRLSILMFADNVQQQTELSEHQRKIIQGLTDGLLAELHRSLVDEFEMYVPAADEHGQPLTDEPADEARGAAEDGGVDEGNEGGTEGDDDG